MWRRNRTVEDIRVDTLTDGWRHWRDFSRVLDAAGKNVFPSDAEALEADQGRYLGFVRSVARRTGHEVANLYDSATGVRVGVDG